MEKKMAFIMEATMKSMVMSEDEWKNWVKVAGVEAGFTEKDITEAFFSKT